MQATEVSKRYTPEQYLALEEKMDRTLSAVSTSEKLHIPHNNVREITFLLSGQLHRRNHHKCFDMTKT